MFYRSSAAGTRHERRFATNLESHDFNYCVHCGGVRSTSFVVVREVRLREGNWPDPDSPTVRVRSAHCLAAGSIRRAFFL
jgi:hypothetical protein